MLPYILDGIPPDLDTSRCTTGERNTPDTGMPDQSRSGGIARPINEVQDTRRKSRILDYLSKYCPISHEPNLPAENSQYAETLVISLGFATAVHPNARHGAIFQVNRYSGMFHGAISANTPIGERCSYVSTLSFVQRAAVLCCWMYVAKHLRH